VVLFFLILEVLILFSVCLGLSLFCSNTLHAQC